MLTLLYPTQQGLINMDFHVPPSLKLVEHLHVTLEYHKVTNILLAPFGAQNRGTGMCMQVGAALDQENDILNPTLAFWAPVCLSLSCQSLAAASSVQCRGTARD